MTTIATRLAALRAPSPWLLVPVLGTLGIVVFFLLEQGSLVQSVAYDVVGIAVIGASLIGLLVHRPRAWQPWLLMIAGQLAFVVGDVIWTVFEVQGVDPFPSTADVAYLLGYPLLSLGLLFAIRSRISGGDRAGLLDAAILATGTAVVWWAFVLGPLAAASDPEPLSFAISVAYPIGDLLLIGMALGLAMSPGARSASFGMLLASLVVVLIGDLWFSLQTLDDTYVDGGLLDGLWLVAYVLFATAAVHPSMASLAEARPVAVALLGPVRILLLAAAMLVGPALLVVGREETDAVVVVVAIASAILSVLVLTRLFGMVRILNEDIERRAALEEQLSYQAFHDPLTGLANRRRFMTTVAGALAEPTGTAALFLDLDDFKDVNDTMGHDAGDALLEVIGKRLVEAVRPTDVVSRLGGDEFAALLPGIDDVESAEVIANRLLEALAAPIEIEGVLLRTSGSIGVAMREPVEPMTVDELLRRADVAMYHAKARGKGRVARHTSELDAAAAAATPRPAAVRRSVPAA